MIRALLEGVSYSQKDGLDVIEGLGAPVGAVRASGGGARSAFWRRLLSDILGKKVVTLDTQEGSAYGAALLATVGTGAYATVPEVCRAVIKEVDSVTPRPHESQLYVRGHEVYRQLYPVLKPVYRLIQNLA